MRITILLLLCSLHLFGADDKHDLSTGNAFVRTCSSIYKADGDPRRVTDDDVVNVGACSGYLTGLHDGLQLAQLNVVGKAEVTTLFCLPEDGIELGQQIKIVIKFIKENPEKAHLPTSILAANALRKAFPCPR